MLPPLQDAARAARLCVIALAAYAAVSLVVPITRAQDKSATSGPALGAGLGVDNVFLGGHVLYYVQLPNPLWRVAGHAGFGGFPGRPWGLGGTGGLMVAFGHHHRLVLDLIAGTMDFGTIQLHGVQAGQRSIAGIGALIGWEWMSRRGFFFRAGAGPAYEFLPPLLRTSSRFTFTANLLSLGYKLW